MRLDRGNVDMSQVDKAIYLCTQYLAYQEGEGYFVVNTVVAFGNEVIVSVDNELEYNHKGRKYLWV